MTDGATIDDLRAVLRPLALHEADFARGDQVVNQVAAFKRLIDRLDGPQEPWLKQWLEDEHYKAGVLYTAAKINWNRDQEGLATDADRRMRATIVGRFNAWVTEVQERLSAYEQTPRGAADVAAWREGLDRFKKDPVHNP